MNATAPEHGPRAFRLFLAAAVLILATAAVYLPVIGHDFISYDDPYYVTENPLVTPGFTTAGVRGAFAKFHVGNWHPLTWLSHMLDVELFGLDPRGHHLTSLLLHTANAVVLFRLLVALTGAPLRSAAVAALFAIHPLQVESVAWVAERKNILSMFFGLLTTAAYLRLKKKFSVGRYLAVVLLFGLCLMAKPMLVTLPFALLLLDFWPLGRFLHPRNANGALVRRGAVRGAILEKLPLFIMTIASCVVTYRAQAQGVVSSAYLPLGMRNANALISYLNYLWKMALPLRLAVFYPHPGRTLPSSEAALAGIALVIASAIAVRAWRRHPFLAVGWFWYLGTLVPVIGIVQVGSQGMADRYVYAPLIGISILIVWGVAALLNRWRAAGSVRAVAAGAGLSLLVLLAITARAQLGQWNDSATLFRHAAAATGDNVVAEFNLALLLDRADSGDEAIAHYRAALRLIPENPDGWLKLVRALLRLGRIEEAKRESRWARRLNDTDAQLPYNLGVAFAEKGELEEAAWCYRESLERNPVNLEARNNLGVVLWRLGRIEEALVCFADLARRNPDDAVTQHNMAEILRRQGRYAAAIARYRAALRIAPDMRAAALGLEIAARMSDR